MDLYERKKNLRIFFYENLLIRNIFYHRFLNIHEHPLKHMEWKTQVRRVDGGLGGGRRRVCMRDTKWLCYIALWRSVAGQHHEGACESLLFPLVGVVRDNLRGQEPGRVNCKEAEKGNFEHGMNYLVYCGIIVLAAYN